MATLLTANNGHRYSRSSFFSAAGNAFTMSAWVWVTALPAAGQYRNAFGMNGSMGAGVRTSGADSLWFIGTNTNDFDSSTGLVATGTWYHLVLARSGNTKTLYVDGVQRASGSDTEAGNTGLVVGDFTTTGDNTSNWNGRLGAVKVWDGVALTAEELLTERWQYAPHRFANLRAFYPLLSIGEDETDYYVNGLTLTVTQVSGSIATAEGPPIPWMHRRSRRSSVAVSGGGSSDTPLAVDHGQAALAGQQVATAFAAAVSSADAAAQPFDVVLLSTEAYVLPVTHTVLVIEGQDIPFSLAQPGQDGEVAAEGSDITLPTPQALPVDHAQAALAGQAIALPMAVSVQHAQAAAEGQDVVQQTQESYMLAVDHAAGAGVGESLVLASAITVEHAQAAASRSAVALVAVGATGTRRRGQRMRAWLRGMRVA